MNKDACRHCGADIFGNEAGWRNESGEWDCRDRRPFINDAGVAYYPVGRQHEPRNETPRNEALAELIRRTLMSDLLAAGLRWIEQNRQEEEARNDWYDLPVPDDIIEHDPDAFLGIRDVDDAEWYTLPEEKVLITTLVGYQKGLHSEVLTAYLENEVQAIEPDDWPFEYGDDSPRIYRRGGRLLLEDGYHRVVAWSMMGDTHVSARICEIDT